MALVALVGTASLPALAHQAGFHKRIFVSISRDALEVLVTMDIDGSARCAGLRSGADADGDGQLAGAELDRLKQRLVDLARRKLSVTVAGYRLPLVVEDAKLNLRRDFRVSDRGLSLAIRFKSSVWGAQRRGDTFVVADDSPDHSPISVQVLTASTDGGVETARRTLPSGESVSFTLGSASVGE